MTATANGNALRKNLGAGFTSESYTMQLILIAAAIDERGFASDIAIDVLNSPPAG
jgi:hypothetical protein